MVRAKKTRKVTPDTSLLSQIGNGGAVRSYIAGAAAIITAALLTFVAYTCVSLQKSVTSPVVVTTILQIAATLIAATYAWKIDVSGGLRIFVALIFGTLALEPYVVEGESVVQSLIYTPAILVALILTSGLVWRLRVTVILAAVGGLNYLAAVYYSAATAQLHPPFLVKLLPLTAITIFLSGLIVVFWERVTQTLLRRSKELLRERELLLRETNHRVKNSLQTISTLLDMQRRTIPDGSADKALSTARDRVSAVAAVHEAIHTEAPDQGVRLSGFLHRLIESLRSSYAGEGLSIRLEFAGPDPELPGKVPLPLLLALNELVINAVQHGFVQGEPGSVILSCREGESGQIQLAVTDTGPGLPEGFDPKSSDTLGMSILHAVVEDQLRGRLRFENNGGTTAILELPEEIFDISESKPSPGKPRPSLRGRGAETTP